MNVVFFGLGSIGRRHAGILQEDFRHGLFAYRTKKGTNAGCGVHNISELYTWKELQAVSPGAAFITNPTFLHIKTAIECARRGMALFIEKPLDSDVRQLKKFLEVVSSKNITTYVAYVLRFHPVINRLKEDVSRYHFLHMRVWSTSYLHLWRPAVDPRQSYSAHSRMGGELSLIFRTSWITPSIFWGR